MMRTSGWKTLGMAVLALLVGTAAMAEGGWFPASYGSSRASRHVMPCMAGEAKADHAYSHCATCEFAARYAKADADCLVGTLHADHRAILARMNRLAAAAPDDRAGLWADFRRALLPHMQAEERTLYPALQENAATRALGMQGEEEHAAAAEVFQKLEVGDFTSDRWMARFATLHEMLGTHIRTEESEVLPAARRALSLDVMRQLCAAFVEQKQNARASLPPMPTVTASMSSVVTQPNIPAAPVPSAPMVDEETAGFDDLGTQNMTLYCPDCGAAVGTVCQYEQSCADRLGTPPAAKQTPTGTSTTKNDTSGTQDRSDAAPIAPYQNAAILRCPNCGAKLGSVCPYTSTGAKP